MELCLGIDVGGTFTDAVLTDGAKVSRAKSPTVTADLGQSVLDATTLLAERAGFALPELLPRIGRFGLGTTAVTNVLTARTGVRVGLVTTAGFEDSLPLAKGRRVSDGIWSVYPEAILPRRSHCGRAGADRPGRPRARRPGPGERGRRRSPARRGTPGRVTGCVVSLVLPQSGSRIPGGGGDPRRLSFHPGCVRCRSPAHHPRVREDRLCGPQRLRRGRGARHRSAVPNAGRARTDRPGPPGAFVRRGDDGEPRPGMPPFSWPGRVRRPGWPPPSRSPRRPRSRTWSRVTWGARRLTLPS